MIFRKMNFQRKLAGGGSPLISYSDSIIKLSDKAVEYFDLLIGAAVLGFLLVVNYYLVDQLIEYRSVQLINYRVLAYHIYELVRRIGLLFQMFNPYFQLRQSLADP